MPPLPRPHWEVICLARANGDSLKHSYEAGKLKYDPGTAAKFFKKPEVIARIAEIQAEHREMDLRARQVAAQESGVDLGWTESHYKNVVLLGLRGDPVRDATGKKKRDPETGEVIYKRDLLAATRALDSLTRMKGGFIDRTEIGSPGDFSRMADDELDAKIIETAKGLGLSSQGLKMLENLTKKEAAE
jgi:hypothetical protein